MIDFFTYVKDVGLRIAGLLAFIQGISWIYKVDEDVHNWSGEHLDLVTIGLILYISWDYLMWGNIKIRRDIELQSKRRKRK